MSEFHKGDLVHLAITKYGPDREMYKELEEVIESYGK